MAGKYERTHQKLIDQGMQLMFDRGFEKVKITDICREAAISRPTFYLHFKCREHLIAEYYESSFFFTEDMEKWVRRAPDRWSAIIRIQMLYMQHMYNTDHVDLISRYLSYKLMSGSTDAFPEFRSKLEDILIVLLREAQEEQIIGNTADPYYLCRTIFMLHTGHLFNWCSSGGKLKSGTDFFWNLETMLCVDREYWGSWKLPENFIYDH